MGQYEISGVGIAVGSEESNYIELRDGATIDVVGVTDLVRRAGGVVIGESLASALQYPHDEDWRDVEREARERSGMSGTPPVYRVRISVEIERVSDDQAKEWWKRREWTYDQVVRLDGRWYWRGWDAGDASHVAPDIAREYGMTIEEATKRLEAMEDCGLLVLRDG